MPAESSACESDAPGPAAAARGRAGQGAGLEARAHRYAALGDPARLGIVDRLVLGDRSVGALREELGLASNLLAHHLAVLAEVGLIARHRSEGDRRRSYVRLLPAALDLLPVPAGTTWSAGPAWSAGSASPLGSQKPAERLLFVCTGNSSRSPLAAALWSRRSRLPAASAGTHPAEAVSSLAASVGRAHGVDISSHRPRGLDRRPDPAEGPGAGARASEVAGGPSGGALIITLCDRAHEELSRRSSGDGATAPMLHWSVPNPGPIGTRAAHETAFVEIADRIEALRIRLGG